MNKKEKPSISSALGLPSIDELRDFTKNNPSFDIEIDEDDDDDEIEDSQAFLSSLSQEQLNAALESMKQLKSFRNQLREIPDITSRKKSLDKLASMAEDKFNDIFDRGFTAEDRYMAEIISAANAMLKIALDAHSKVIESDIKLIDMQIKKDKMEIDLNMKNKLNSSLGVPDAEPEEEKGNTTIIRANRNEMLKNKER